MPDLPPVTPPAFSTPRLTAEGRARVERAPPRFPTPAQQAEALAYLGRVVTRRESVMMRWSDGKVVFVVVSEKERRTV